MPPTGRGHLRPSIRAFTLIEMIVLILIIAVLASVATPRYALFLERARFDGAIEEVMALLAEARAASLRTGRDTDVVFDAQSGMIRARTIGREPEMDLPVELQSDPSLDSGARSARPVLLPEHVTIGDYQSLVVTAREDSQNTGLLRLVSFYGDGGSTGARLLLISQDGHRRMLEISVTTGRASEIDEETGS